MKKSNSNKGYSFVELILTLAVFSIVMLAIILMMRTSLASYKNGLFEAEMQEEAQIIATQVADLLVDATAYNGEIVSGGQVIGYKFSGPVNDGDAIADFAIRFDGDKLVYLQGSSVQPLSNMVKNKYNVTVDEDGNETSSLAVKGFTISGLNKKDESEGSTDVSLYDNAAHITIHVEGKEGRDYTVEKDVFFRNSIEDSTSFDLAKNTATNDTENPVDDTRDDVPILRFEGYDFSREYGLVYDAKLSDDCAGKFQLDETTDTLVKTKIDGKTPKHVVVKPVSSYESPSTGFDLSLMSGSGKEYSITGLDYNGNPVNVKFHLDAVSFDVASGIFHQPINSTVGDNSNSGYPTYIIAKGISVKNCNLKKTYTTLLKCGNHEAKAGSTTLSTYSMGNDPGDYASELSQAGSYTKINTVGGNKNDGTGYKIALCADQASNGLVIHPLKQAYQSKDYVKNFAALSGDKKLTYELTFTSTTDASNKKVYTIVEDWKLAGTLLQ